MTFIDGDEFKVPDVVGAIVGWRTWNILGPRPACGCGACNDYGRDAVGLSSRDEWPADEPLRAVHKIPHFRNDWHPAPETRCLCGIHAIKDPADLIGLPGAAHPNMLLRGSAVAGQVALWGRVIPHERGWRAEWAKPLSIVRLWDVEPEDARAVRDRYNLPLVECPGLGEAVETWEAHYNAYMQWFGTSRQAATGQKGGARWI